MISVRSSSGPRSAAGRFLGLLDGELGGRRPGLRERSPDRAARSVCRPSHRGRRFDAACWNARRPGSPASGGVELRTRRTRGTAGCRRRTRCGGHVAGPAPRAGPAAASSVKRLRVLKPGGRLLLVDLLPHDRVEYRRTPGSRLARVLRGAGHGVDAGRRICASKGRGASDRSGSEGAGVVRGDWREIEEAGSRKQGRMASTAQQH